jgi:regulatory protein
MHQKRKNPDEFQKARNYALRLLKIRLRSKEELVGRLKQKGYAGPLVDEIIQELEDAKLLDDKRFATFFASDQLEFRIKGPRYIRYKLRMLGVEEHVVESALKEVFEGADLKKVFYRFVRSHRSKSREDVSKLLIKRGFDPQTVHQTLLAIYEEWRCEDEPRNDVHSDISSDSHPNSDIGISPREDEGAQRTEESKRKRE